MSEAVFVSQEKFDSMTAERKAIKEEKIPAIAKRIEEAKQLGDLSENAEYHAARDEMAWAQSRILELDHLLQNAEVVVSESGSSTIRIGTRFVARAKEKEKTFTIVGGQEASPLEGKISNESPLGSAFLGKKKGDTVTVQVPAGKMEYTIVDLL